MKKVFKAIWNFLDSPQSDGIAAFILLAFIFKCIMASEIFIIGYDWPIMVFASIFSFLFMARYTNYLMFEKYNRGINER